MSCPISNCPSTTTDEGLCDGHTRHLENMLTQIRDFHTAAHDQLVPGDNREEKTKSTELTIGVNVSALSYINANEIYLTLGGWERVVREERHLSPAGLIPPVPGVDVEVLRLTVFHRNQLEWIRRQPWVEEFFGEVRDLHAIGLAAARVEVRKRTRIYCPATITDGNCGRLLTLRSDDPLAAFVCPSCGTEWSSLRLIAVAKIDRSKPLLVDVETAAHLLNRSLRQVQRDLVRLHPNRRRGQLVNLHELLDFYAA